MGQILIIVMIGLLVVNYLRISYGIAVKNHKNSFIAWLLWSIMDGIGLYGTLKKDEDPTLMIVFIFGTVLVAFTLLVKRQIVWTKVEFMICIIVGICIYVSQTASPEGIVYATGIALFCAGVPYLKDLYYAELVQKESITTAYIFLAALLLSTTVTYLAEQLIIIPLLCSLYWIAALVLMKRLKVAAH